MVAFGAGGLSWAAGMGEADLAARGQGAAGLARLLGQQPTTLSRLKESLIDLAVVEGAGHDQVVEVAGRLPQLAVALTDRGGGDPGQLLGQRGPGVATTQGVADARRHNWASWPLWRSVLQPLQQHRGDLGYRHTQVAAGGPLVGLAGGVAAGWGDHIATLAAPVDMLQPGRVDVAEAGGAR
jgi:hypothetical protein